MPKVTINVVTREGTNLVVMADTHHPLMEALRDEGLVEALCGGQAACATCHVHVDEEWMPIVGQPNGQESDMLDSSLEKRATSRLSCQIIVNESIDGLSLTIAPSEG